MHHVKFLHASNMEMYSLLTFSHFDIIQPHNNVFHKMCILLSIIVTEDEYMVFKFV